MQLQYDKKTKYKDIFKTFENDNNISIYKSKYKNNYISELNFTLQKAEDAVELSNFTFFVENLLKASEIVNILENFDNITHFEHKEFLQKVISLSHKFKYEKTRV